MLGIVVALAVMTDVALRLDGPGLVTSGALVTAVVLLALGGRLARVLPRLAVAMVVVMAVLLSVRASVWTTWILVAAATTLVVMTAAGGFEPGRRRPWLDVTAGGCDALRDVPAWFERGWRDASVHRTGKLTVWARSAAGGVVVAAVLVSLLASGDVAFGWLVSGFDAGAVLGHTVLVGLLVVPAAALAVLAQRHTDAARFGARTYRTEARVALWVVAVVLVLWCGLQVAVIIGGAERVLASQGLTAAEYARQGFFQLVAVAAVSLAVLNISHRLGSDGMVADESQRAPAFIIGVALGVLIIVSYSRLGFYIGSFGLTMLRLAVATFLAWLALMTVLSVVRSSRSETPRPWLAIAATLTAAGFAIAFAAINPEARVAAVNLGRATDEQPVDVGYLVSFLGPDAKPTVAAAVAADGPMTDRLAAWLCSDVDGTFGYGPLGWNRSVAAAAEACPLPGG
ncbi:MAG: DUF4153 domain-containing protein [Acidimicrobiales bacterium]